MASNKSIQFEGLAQLMTILNEEELANLQTELQNVVDKHYRKKFSPTLQLAAYQMKKMEEADASIENNRSERKSSGSSEP